MGAPQSEMQAKAFHENLATGLSFGFTEPLYQALSSGVADVHDRVFHDETYLHLAVRAGNEAMVEYLLARGAEVDVQNSNDQTPFCYAARDGHIAIAQRLLKAGADCDLRDRQGRTPLFRAVELDQEAMVHFLLEAGADAELADTLGKRPVDEADRALVNPVVLDALQSYVMPPRVACDAHLTREKLLEKNAAGLCALDANLTWYRWENYREQLAQNGERLSKDDLSQPGKNGTSYLARACASGLLDSLWSDMQAAGETLTDRDLLTEDGKANEVLQAIVKDERVAVLFQREIWIDQSLDALKSVYRALPDEAKTEIGNYHALCSEVAQRDAAQNVNTGRQSR